MLPIVLDPKSAKVGLAGEGDGLARRRALLADAGVEPVPVRPQDGAALPSLRVLFIAGLERDASEGLALSARAAGVLVNVEDVPELCDFHVPAIVRRGDLVLTASTGGRAPGLAQRLREWFQTAFGPEWSGRLDDIGSARTAWRAQGLPPNEVSRRTKNLVSEKGWLS